MKSHLISGSSTTSPAESRRGSGSGDYTESRKSTPKKKNPPVEVTKKVDSKPGSPPKSPSLVLSEPAKERKNTLTSTDSSVLKVAEALEDPKPRRGSTSGTSSFHCRFSNLKRGKIAWKTIEFKRLYGKDISKKFER